MQLWAEVTIVIGKKDRMDRVGKLGLATAHQRTILINLLIRIYCTLYFMCKDRVILQTWSINFSNVFKGNVCVWLVSHN
jgi:hypothetical protein